MLSFEHQGDQGPLLVLLHWLGGGAQTWQEVSHGLAQRGLQTAALDLPGFGQVANQPATDVADGVQAAIDTIVNLRAGSPETPWLLGGHSMGGKIAMAIARRALDGEPGLEKLRGLILVSPSPPGPEPIQEARRREHLETFGQPTDTEKRRKDAASWVDHNTGELPLPAAVRNRAIEGILAIPPASFASWFLKGSKEDWSARIGSVPLPTLLFTGSAETSLGAEAQQTRSLPHLPNLISIDLLGAKHLAPLERPGELVEYITEFATTQLNLTLSTPTGQPSGAFATLLASERTSSKTRETMQNRLAKRLTWNNQPRTFTPGEFRTLRALAQAIVPDAGFDLAACIDAQLASNEGDGWRYADLPSDPEAWRRGLLSLDIAAKHEHGVLFLSLQPIQQHDLLTDAAKGKLGQGLLGALHLTEAAKAFSAAEMKQWFEDARAEFTRFYIADPRTMSRIGYTGFADDLGFTQIQLGQHEEPSA